MRALMPPKMMAFLLLMAVPPMVKQMPLVLAALEAAPSLGALVVECCVGSDMADWCGATLRSSGSVSPSASAAGPGLEQQFVICAAVRRANAFTHQHSFHVLLSYFHLTRVLLGFFLPEE